MEKVVHIKNITDGTHLKIDGEDELHVIGLGQDGTIQTAPMSSTDKFTDIPSVIIVPLLRLTKCQHGGLMLTSFNKDIACFVNKEILLSEINLLGGSIIEVADKKLKVIIGPITKERRLLPQTPGISVSKKPPPKPRRGGDNSTAESEDNKDWYHVQHPSLDHELLQQMTSSRQIGDLAASFLTKQVNVYTDSKLCTKMTDDIFKFMQLVEYKSKSVNVTLYALSKTGITYIIQEIVEYQKHIVFGYLKEVTTYLDEMPESERDRPMHAPAIKLLVELLRQILDPLSHVVLCLQLLRKFSHFPQNLPIIIKCKAATAVMGCMAVYLNEEDVQLNCLDILAKITTFQYQLTEKVQIRETGLEMIIRAIDHHTDHEDILQSACRCLANLTASLQTTLDSWLDIIYNSDSGVEDSITTYECLLKHIFKHATPTVQKVLQQYGDNIGIRTEGRRFLYNLSKMTQILTKKNRRMLVVSDDDEVEIEEDNGDQTNENLVTPTVLTPTKKSDIETKSILRNQCEKSPGVSHQVHFVDDESVTSFTSSDEDSDGNDYTDLVKRKEAGGAVIEITETRKLTKTEIRNFKVQHASDLELLSSLEWSIEAEACDGLEQKEVDNSKHDSSDSELEHSEELQTLAENTSQLLNIEDKLDSSTESTLTTSVTSNIEENDDSVEEIVNLDNQQTLTTSVNNDTEENDASVEEMVNLDNQQTLNLDNQQTLTTSVNNDTEENDAIVEEMVDLDNQETLTTSINSNIEENNTSVEEMVNLDNQDTTNVTELNSQQNSSENLVSCTNNKTEQDIEDIPEFPDSFSVSDVEILSNVIRMKVVQHVSCLVIGGNDSQALKDINFSILVLLEKAEAPRVLIDYTNQQYDASKTLLDVDTAFLISLVDAIRYTSLLPDLLRKSLLDVVGGLQENKKTFVTHVAVSCVKSAFTNDTLLPIITEETFTKTMKTSLQSVVQNSKHLMDIMEILG